MGDSTDRVRIERDLYRGLLSLGAADDPRALLEAALRRLVEATGARQGYVALYGGADLAAEPPFALAHDCTADDVAELRSRLSRGSSGARSRRARRSAPPRRSRIRAS